VSGGAVIGPGSNAAVRIADVLLRNVGGRTVLLQMPAPAIPGDIGEQLGLATPQFQNVELGPVAFRRVRAKTGTANKPAEATYELLVSAVTVAKAAGALGMQAAETLFAQAAGVIVDDSTLSITWVASAEAFGSVYLYRLGLRGAIKDFL
jgi:hypothetical protein